MEAALHSDCAAPAQYANFFRVGHNAAELVIDFCQSYGGEGEARPDAVVARVIVTPEGARELHRLLGESLE
jgi:hypothetical protein